MPEPVAGAGDDQGAGRERGVEQRERLGFGQPGQGHDVGGVEVVTGDRQAAQQRGRGVVEVEEPRGHRVPDRRGTAGDPPAADARASSRAKNGLPCASSTIRASTAGLRRAERAGLDQRGHLLAVERAEIDLRAPPRPVQPRRRRESGVGARDSGR